jgi:hypothetical protein
MLARRNWEESLQARRFSPNHFGSNGRQVLYLPPSYQHFVEHSQG